MFRTKSVDKMKTFFMFNNFFFENHDVYEIVWENMVQPDSLHMAK